MDGQTLRACLRACVRACNAAFCESSKYIRSKLEYFVHVTLYFRPASDLQPDTGVGDGCVGVLGCCGASLLSAFLCLALELTTRTLCLSIVCKSYTGISWLFSLRCGAVMGCCGVSVLPMCCDGRNGHWQRPFFLLSAI